MAKTSQKIFLIEDDKSLANTLTEFLREQGYEVEQAYTGKEALRILPTIRPDLILLDIILPELSGLEFLKEIQKKDSEFKEMPVLILSNLEGDQKNFEAMGVKIHGYFVKANYSLEELGKKIKKALNE
mgnify:FL=1